MEPARRRRLRPAQPHGWIQHRIDPFRKPLFLGAGHPFGQTRTPLDGHGIRRKPPGRQRRPFAYARILRQRQLHLAQPLFRRSLVPLRGLLEIRRRQQVRPLRIAGARLEPSQGKVPQRERRLAAQTAHEHGLRRQRRIQPLSGAAGLPIQLLAPIQRRNRRRARLDGQPPSEMGTQSQTQSRPRFRTSTAASTSTTTRPTIW